jgi:hypothetical protein
LAVQLAGLAPNTSAIGARIHVTTSSGTQMREVLGGASFTSQVPYTQYFGLSKGTMADLIEVEWLDGSVDSYTNVPSGYVRYLQE